MLYAVFLQAHIGFSHYIPGKRKHFFTGFKAFLLHVFADVIRQTFQQLLVALNSRRKLPGLVMIPVGDIGKSKKKFLVAALTRRAFRQRCSLPGITTLVRVFYFDPEASK